MRARNGETERLSEQPDSLHADIVVKGRNVEVPDHFRIHVEEKLSRLERFHPSVYLFDVELHHEKNRRQSKTCQRIEITARGKGPVVRAEASAESFYAALETAVDKLESRFRRFRDRRKVHHGARTPISVAKATAVLSDAQPLPSAAPGENTAAEPLHETSAGEHRGALNGAELTEVPGLPSDEYPGPGHIVRTKEHPSEPMSVDDALSEMELVGHDFYLFHDVETDKPSVVYRRHAFDYGLIRLA
ncbi:ribosome-associated translation inhibitor RaiA [Hoyosella sp. YIM 151337]|uniref:ribosome hibernation-promoting factor, HPF/YfiA family n=1 Tax=Hoyosella sp. YIM 151337 TaxID=2992742 RepID=UPI002235BE70|nr:ribosome-associated translation inhibitor RaiA [Hoyosella sp. YIM 151337]MCW4352299.1 ribosome-associated translation inhibitor RaiA [Hoyosella sp. YIM 151337]